MGTIKTILAKRKSRTPPNHENYQQSSSPGRIEVGVETYVPLTPALSRQGRGRRGYFLMNAPCAEDPSSNHENIQP
jgi:hypothetical protein